MNHAPTHTQPQRGVIVQTLIREETPTYTVPIEKPRPAIELNGETLFYSLAIVLMVTGLWFLLVYFWGVLTA